MNKIDYAPVVIPTLNRFDHFKRCLESLERVDMLIAKEHLDYLERKMHSW